MSLQALVWAFGVELRPATTKFVLVALADYASDENLCFPSIKTLADKTSLDRKTVIRCLDRLEAEGLIHDTGKTCGATGQVKIYEIHPNSPKSGTVNDGSKSPVFPTKESRFSHGNSPVFPTKESQKRDTEPQDNHPVLTSQTNHKGDEPSEIPELLRTAEFGEAWEMYVRHRTEKRAKLTSQAARQQLKNLEKMGVERAIAAIHHSVGNGWTGIFEPRPKQQTPQERRAAQAARECPEPTLKSKILVL